MKTPLIPLIALGLVSCIPKAEIIEESQPQGNSSPKPPVQTPPPTLPKINTPNDGLRINEEEIFTLPSDDQLRSSTKPKKDTDSPIIIRPPSE